MTRRLTMRWKLQCLAVALTLTFSAAHAFAEDEPDPYESDDVADSDGAKTGKPDAPEGQPGKGDEDGAEGDDSAPDDGAPDDGAERDDGAPEDGAPDDGDTDDGAPEDGAPDDGDTTLDEDTAEDDASNEDAADESEDTPSEDTSEKEDDVEPPPVAREDEPLVLLKNDASLRIKERPTRLRESAYARLREIAKRYHAATQRKLVVTGGGRKPARQAELMHDMMAEGKNLLHLYIQVALVKPLIKAYEQGKAKRWGRRRTVAVMTKIIDDQVKAGKYVSRHLAHTAADVRSRGLKDEHVTALEKAVADVEGARLVDERNGNAPHFHLSL